MADRYRILVLNQISDAGLKRLPAGIYDCSREVANPDAVLVRSADMHAVTIPESVKAIGRAGAGTNNIPVKDMSARGIPVFNAPGANANAVKELVLAGMLMAARNLVPAVDFVRALEGDDRSLHGQVEEGKKQFAGIELPNHTLGVIGLGKIGSLVADAAIRLGMNVLGFDPEITVEAAWSLSSQVRKAHSIDEVLKGSHFVTLHVPLVEATRHLVNQRNLQGVRPGTVLLNFSREGIVDDAAVVEALAAKRLRYYVTDFPSSVLDAHAGVIALPHLGASTLEAEENCAVMVVDQLREFLENGNIVNSVNFPTVTMQREAPFRLCVVHANVPNMVGQISATMGESGLNIHNMINKSRDELAYTLLDVDSAPPPPVLATLRSIEGVMHARFLSAAR
ncbi:MAG: phosphoglycerate dehydrogenase [Gammaproteobacteria bacterium]|nr:phosphoglycerate dehydrogenase [Gammaproteobacteria bacterium]